MLLSVREKNFAEKAAYHLKVGKPLVFPTETVYGIGASIEKEENIKRIIDLKERDEKKPMALMFGNIEEIKNYFEIGEGELKIAEKFLPGPLTLLLKRKKKIPKWFYPDFEKLGVRIPKCEAALKILNAFHQIIAATSANKSGKEEAKTFETTLYYFGRYPDVLIVDGGKTEGVKPSTVMEIDKGEIKILREGDINLDMIKEALYEK